MEAPIHPGYVELAFGREFELQHLVPSVVSAKRQTDSKWSIDKRVLGYVFGAVLFGIVLGASSKALLYKEEPVTRVEFEGELERVDQILSSMLGLLTDVTTLPANQAGERPSTKRRMISSASIPVRSKRASSQSTARPQRKRCAKAHFTTRLCSKSSISRTSSSL